MMDKKQLLDLLVKIQYEYAKETSISNPWMEISFVADKLLEAGVISPEPSASVKECEGYDTMIDNDMWLAPCGKYHFKGLYQPCLDEPKSQEPLSDSKEDKYRKALEEIVEHGNTPLPSNVDPNTKPYKIAKQALRIEAPSEVKDLENKISEIKTILKDGWLNYVPYDMTIRQISRIVFDEIIEELERKE